MAARCRWKVARKGIAGLLPVVTLLIATAAVWHMGGCSDAWSSAAKSGTSRRQVLPAVLFGAGATTAADAARAATPMVFPEKNAGIPKAPIKESDDPNIYRVVRPLSMALDKLFTFDLPKLNGTSWATDATDRKSADARFTIQVKGAKKEPPIELLAGKSPAAFSEEIQALNFTENGTGMVKNETVGLVESLEWVDSEYLYRKERLIHKWAFILHTPKRKGDILLFLTAPEERSGTLQKFWESVCSTFRRVS